MKQIRRSFLENGVLALRAFQTTERDAKSLRVTHHTVLHALVRELVRNGWESVEEVWKGDRA